MQETQPEAGLHPGPVVLSELPQGERAKQKATERGLTATYRVMDALALKKLPEVFDSAIDSGLFMALSNAERVDYPALSAVFTISLNTSRGKPWV